MGEEKCLCCYQISGSVSLLGGGGQEDMTIK